MGALSDRSFTGVMGGLEGCVCSRVKEPGTVSTLVGVLGGALAQVTMMGSRLESAGRILKVQVPF